jgi:hypothetical protein
VDRCNVVGNGIAKQSHTWVEERLSAYIDNQLDALERAQLERHLRDCDQCRASLSSLQWTISLLKQAPAPALSRSFTLPVPKESKRATAPTFNLGFAARWATVVATLLLFAIVGIDAITQFGGATNARPAMAPAAELQIAPTSVALAQPTATSSVARDAASSAPASSVASSRAPEPAPTKAPAPVGAAPAALPPAAPTQRAPASSSAPTGLGSGAPETSTTTDNSSKSITTTTTAKAFAVPTATPTETPTPTATLAPSPTAPLVAQAKSEPTRTPVTQNQARSATPSEIISPLRIAEIATLFFAVFFGALAILLRRK